MSPWIEYLSGFRGSARDLIISTLGAAAQSLVLVPVALLIRYAFDRAVPSADIAALVLVGAGIVILHVLGGALLLWSRHTALRVTKAAVGRLREELLTKVYAVPRSTLLASDIPDMHALIVQDSERVDAGATTIVTQLVPSVLVTAVLAAFLVFLDWMLFLVVVATVPILSLVLRSVGRLAKPRTRAFHESFARFSTGVLFVLQRAELTKSHGAEDFEISRQSRSIAELGAAGARMGWWHAAYNVVQETVTSASWALVLVGGGVAVAAGTMTIGEVLSFSLVALILKRAVNSTLTSIPIIVEGRASLARLRRLTSLPVDASPGGSRRIRFEGRIRLDGVDFQYGADPLLTGVNVVTEPQRITAITGPSGSGKTSLLFLILGFHQPTAGTITAEGIPYAEARLSDVRSGIGYVSQSSFVFGGTVLENIAYGDAHPDLARARAAARHALVDEFVDGLPNGYGTDVGEDGALISGGQRQRIALARALYRGPRLLLLDEPTSQMDEELASCLVRELRQLPECPAVVVVSHDAVVLQAADEVIDLGARPIVPRGTRGPGVAA